MAERVAVEQPITSSHATHGQIVTLFEHGAKRLENSRARIAFCRAVRRGLATVSIDKAWLSSAGAAAGDWLEVVLPERQTLDLDLTNTLGEDPPELHRVPLGTTDTDDEDADQLEVWAQSALDGSLDYDALAGVAVQDGECAVLVVPDRADMLGAPEYTEETGPPDPKTQRRPRRPRAEYDRDARGRRPRHPQYGGRDEARSKQAWQERYQRWLADNPPWSVRLISATDCVPILVRGRRNKRWECTGLIVRTLFQKEELIRRKYAWADMDTELIPREHGAASTYGADGMVYLYEAYLLDEDGTPYCTYSVGGKETWDTAKADGDDAPVINFKRDFGLDVKLWDYAYFLHLEDDPDYRGVPFIWPLVPSLLNAEGALTAIVAAAWENAFGGHVMVPDPNVEKAAYLDGTGRFRKFVKPKPGEVKLMPGPVAPFAKAETGPDIYRVAEILTRTLQQYAADAGAGAADADGASGHALVISNQLFEASKRQIRQGILQVAEFVADRILRIACAWEQGDPPRHQRRPAAAVFVTHDEQLPTGEVRENTSVLPLDEGWVGGNYRLHARFPKRGNLAEIQLAANLAERGFGSDEDVYEQQGKKSTVLARVKAAEWKYVNSPEGLLEYQIRRAQYRGDQQRLAALRLIQQQRQTVGGVPTAAIAPEAPGSSVLGAGMPGENPAQNMLQGAVNGQMRTGPEQNDAEAVAALGGDRVMVRATTLNLEEQVRHAIAQAARRRDWDGMALLLAALERVQERAPHRTSGEGWANA